MFTIDPPPFRRRCGTAALQPYHALFVFRRNDSSHSASGMSSKLERVIGMTLSMPALLTMPVSFPKACAARSTALLNFSKSRTSVATAIAWKPFLQMPSATSWLRAASMSSRATFAPSDASRSAYALPMPCAAPVTTTALSASRIPLAPSRAPSRARGAFDVDVPDRPQAVPLGHRGVTQVAPDEDRDAAVVAREL